MIITLLIAYCSFRINKISSSKCFFFFPVMIYFLALCKAEISFNISCSNNISLILVIPDALITVVSTPHTQHEWGKVISVGVHIYK